MAPYSPPTGGRAGKLRLDFNENTVGCSPRVVAALREGIDAEQLAIYPEYSEAKETIARYFRVRPELFVFTNGTDEAIQVFVNTYLDDGQEAVLLKPSYAMYRFYCQVAGARIKEVEYPQPGMELPLHPGDPRGDSGQPQQPHRNRRGAAGDRAHSAPRAQGGRVGG
jgi:histidinol-phosphate aminotransferase